MKALNNQQRMFLKDLAAFVQHALKHDLDFGLVRATLMHDLTGDLNDGTWLPRTFGYNKKKSEE
jgi:hypothetical protein